MTVSNPIEALLAVQEQDLRILQMEQELRDIPARKNEEQHRLNEHKQSLVQAEEDLKREEAEVKKLDLESEARKEKISKLRQQQMELKTNKEFKAIEHEIAALEAQILEFEDRELVLMESVEQARQQVAAARASLQEEADAVEVDVRELDARAARIEGELEGVRRTREDAAQGVDPAWMAAYNRIRVRRSSALVPIQDGVCGGCHMKLTPSVVNEARKRSGMVSCDHCGRLLYWT